MAVDYKAIMRASQDAVVKINESKYNTIKTVDKEIEFEKEAMDKLIKYIQEATQIARTKEIMNEMHS